MVRAGAIGPITLVLAVGEGLLERLDPLLDLAALKHPGEDLQDGRGARGLGPVNARVVARLAVDGAGSQASSPLPKGSRIVHS
jgi:hypothetical protein